MEFMANLHKKSCYSWLFKGFHPLFPPVYQIMACMIDDFLNLFDF